LGIRLFRVGRGGVHGGGAVWADAEYSEGAMCAKDEAVEEDAPAIRWPGGVAVEEYAAAVRRPRCGISGPGGVAVDVSVVDDPADRFAVGPGGWERERKLWESPAYPGERRWDRNPPWRDATGNYKVSIKMDDGRVFEWLVPRDCEEGEDE